MTALLTLYDLPLVHTGEQPFCCIDHLWQRRPRNAYVKVSHPGRKISIVKLAKLWEIEPVLHAQRQA